MKKLLAMLLAAVMLLSVIGAVAEETAEQGTPLVVATSTLSEKFSPYFADTAYDQDVVNMTQASMMTTDRTGGIIYNGIEGETHSYNGTDYTYYGTGDLSVDYDEEADITTYTYKMRDDLKFSDGEPMTIDDVIFNYYVFLDPAYNGSTTLNSYDIVGLQAYRTQIPEASVEETSATAAAVREAYAANGEGYTVTESDPFTQEAYDSYAAAATQLWKEDLQGIVDYVYDNYAADYAESVMGMTAEEIGASDGAKIAFGAAMWGFSVEGDEPTIDDLFASVFAQYAGDLDTYLSVESATGKYTAFRIPKGDCSDIAIDATIRAAAPHQFSRQHEEGKVKITVQGETVTLNYDAKRLEPSIETIVQDDPPLQKVWGDQIYRVTLRERKAATKGAYTFTVTPGAK